MSPKHCCYCGGKHDQDDMVKLNVRQHAHKHCMPKKRVTRQPGGGLDNLPLMPHGCYVRRKIPGAP